MLDTDDDGGARLTVPNAYLIDRTGVSFRNQLIQDFGDARGSLFQARLDGEQDIGGFLSSFKAGLRYAKRTATFYNVHINREEERSVGKEGGSTCRSRWSPCH